MNEEYSVAEEFVKEIYRHKQVRKDRFGNEYFAFQKEKYAQLMRVMPYVVE